MATDVSDSNPLPKLPRGAYTRIARRLRLTPQHVREVALGKRPSKRVEHAIRVWIAKHLPQQAA